MSLDLTPTEETPLFGPELLVASFREAERPRLLHRVGLEHEKFLYSKKTGRPVLYEGGQGVRALFLMLERQGYEPVMEGPENVVVALRRGGATLSLEPGGQLELSGTPVSTAVAAHAENLLHLREVSRAADEVGVGLAAVGFRPFERVDEVPWMPKGRYQVMRRTLGRRGRLAVEMMLQTAAGQVSLDWENEADCAEKVQVAAKVSPVVVALFANSPLREGRESGFLSYRNRVWTEVDPARTGYLPEMLDGSFSYRGYVDWALRAPLLFLRRKGEYLSPQLTFGQLLEQGYEGKPALLSDWVDHLSTLFPEVRLKKVIELRAADCVSAALTGALAAFWLGLLYDPAARRAAARLFRTLTWDEHLSLEEVASREGLGGRLDESSLAELALELVRLARAGLLRQSPGDALLLDPLEEVAREGRSPAEQTLERWRAAKSEVAFLESLVP